MRNSIVIVRFSVGLIALLWLAIGCLWLDTPGLHYDETIFVSGAFPEKPGGAVWKIDLWGQPIAVMVMSYMGALKGWLYRTLLLAAPPTVATVRLPLLLLGTITIFATYKLASTLFSRKAGLVAIILLCADATFLLTTKMDWGPVVIQRLCLVVGCFLVVRSRTLAGLLFFGVALFDKLTFVWVCFGLVAALLLTYSGTVRKVAGTRLLPFYLAALLLPLGPAVYFRLFVGAADPSNLEQHSHHLEEKYGMLTQSFDGTVLHGPLALQSAANPTPATDLPTKALYWLDAQGTFQPGWLRPATTLALLLLPLTAFLPGGRTRVFLALFCLFALLPMALVEGAGSVHHITLIYPFPHIFLASSLVAIADWMRPRTGRVVAVGSLGAATALIAGSSAMNIAHQYAEMVKYGSPPVWTTAIFELSEFVESQPAEHVVAADWGIEHQLIFLSNNKLPLSSVYHAGPENEEALRTAVEALERPETLVVRYASAELSASPIQHELVDEAARVAGVHLELVREIEDRQGRIVYHVYAARPKAATVSAER